MAIELDPRVRRFQAIKAAAKAKAVEAAKHKAEIGRIMAQSPGLSEKQAIRVYESHLRHRNARVVQVGNKTVKVFTA